MCKSVCPPRGADPARKTAPPQGPKSPSGLTEIRFSYVAVEYVSCEPTESARELFDEEYGAVEEEQ